MIDSYTNKPIRVAAYDPIRPYLFVRTDQFEAVAKLLTAHAISYSVYEYDISRNGHPAVRKINLAKHTDSQKVQQILDEAV